MGWLILVYLGLEGLGVFVFLVFAFLFCVAFVSVLFALFLFCCRIVFGVGSCFFCFLFLFFICFFCFCLFCFLEGEVAQRATSLGPKPSLFYFFVCFVFFVFLFVFWEGLGVSFGPPHLALIPP